MIKHSKRKKSEFKQIYDRLKKDFPTAGGYCLLHSKLVKRTDFVHEVCTWRLFHPIHWWMKAHFYSPGSVPPMLKFGAQCGTFLQSIKGFWMAKVKNSPRRFQSNWDRFPGLRLWNTLWSFLPAISTWPNNHKCGLPVPAGHGEEWRTEKWDPAKCLVASLHSAAFGRESCVCNTVHFSQVPSCKQHKGSLGPAGLHRKTSYSLRGLGSQQLYLRDWEHFCNAPITGPWKNYHEVRFTSLTVLL